MDDSSDDLSLSALRSLLDMMDEAVFHTDSGFLLRKGNASFHRLLGLEDGEVHGSNALSLLCGKDDQLKDGLAAQLRASGRWEGEIRLERDRGEIRTASLLLAALPATEGEEAGYVGLIRDLSELKSAKAILEYSANHDSLTGLPNREFFHEALQDLAVRVGTTGGVLAVCLVDLDDFKRVNNDLSREVGDGLLRAVGSRLGEALRTGDLLARSGGDEFSLAFPLKSAAEVRSLAARILGLFDTPFEAGDRLIYLNATMGISLCPDHGDEAGRLSACADLALQSRKAGSKNSYAVYREDLGARLHGKASLASELRAAIEDPGRGRPGPSGPGGRFYVHYQPIIEISSGLVIGTEALARWDHPVRGNIAPAQFIPLAEESSLVVDLGAYVLASACDQVRAWTRRTAIPPKVSVNVSVRQFQDPGFLDMVAKAVAGLPRGIVTLEITESQLFEELDSAAGILAGLKEAGVLLSVDDFGTGYASLSYLKKMPIDTVKIDQSFVADLVRDRHDRRIVEAVATLARGLGARTVAEGVETKAQLELLPRLGVDYAQGFFFSPPISPEGILDLVDGAFDHTGLFTALDEAWPDPGRADPESDSPLPPRERPAARRSR
jgi:diguanylate cyclase (GGDEF)-like protein/PAS domain S-box-containing protein